MSTEESKLSYKEAPKHWISVKDTQDHIQGYVETSQHRPSLVPEIEVVFKNRKPIFIGMDDYSIDQVRWLVNRLQEALVMVEMHRAEKE